MYLLLSVQSDLSDPYQTDEDSDYQPIDSSENSSESEGGDLAALAPDETAKKSRKRVRNPKSWACNQRKFKRAAGLTYKNVKGNVVLEKKFRNPLCNCNLKCHQKINVEQSKKNFEKFYGLANFDLQTAFIFGQIKVIKKARVYTGRQNSRRQFTRLYYLPNENQSDIKVCKEYFKQTLQISDGRLTRVLQNKSDGIAPTDKRGKHPAANKTSDFKVTEVKAFIERFPVFESHYARQKSGERKYLSPDLNIAIMYKLYKQHSESPVSNHVFRNIFSTHYNLHFHAPITDSCRRCDEFNNKLKVTEGEEKRSLETQKELHLRKADLARQEMKKDGDEAKQPENETAAIAFDLMKTLPTPVLSTGITYYKRQLWTYCLGKS